MRKFDIDCDVTDLAEVARQWPLVLSPLQTQKSEGDLSVTDLSNVRQWHRGELINHHSPIKNKLEVTNKDYLKRENS